MGIKNICAKYKRAMRIPFKWHYHLIRYTQLSKKIKSRWWYEINWIESIDLLGGWHFFCLNNCYKILLTVTCTQIWMSYIQKVKTQLSPFQSMYALIVITAFTFTTTIFNSVINQPTTNLSNYTWLIQK